MRPTTRNVMLVSGYCVSFVGSFMLKNENGDGMLLVKPGFNDSLIHLKELE